MLRENLEYNKNVKANSAFLEELKLKLPEFFTAEKKDDDGNVVEESKFDYLKFKNMLDEQNIEEFTSGYQLDFIGKNYAKKQSGERPNTVIVPDIEHNTKMENKNSKNIFLTGDNLEVLRHLQQNYQNSIDFIYIDPPYNTGNDDFIYPDNFEYTDEELSSIFGLTNEELKKLKSIQGRSSHSSWLTFMYPRLYMSKKLLKDEGVIFISIDDNEQSNLKLCLDEIFGENNFISTFHYNKSQNPPSLSNTVRHKFEYVLCYCKNKKIKFSGEIMYGGDSPIYNGGNNVSILNFPADTVHFNIPDGIYKAGKYDETVLLNDLEIKNSLNVNTFNLSGKWRWNQEKLIDEINDDTYLIIKSLKFSPRYLRKGDRVSIPSDLLSMYENGVDTNERGRKEVELLVGDNMFSFPKSVTLIKKLISFVIKNKENATILDFFAGSGTSADAVMQLNAEDGGNRKFILCTLPEKTYTVNADGTEIPTKGGVAAYEAGYKSIDEISRERIKRAAEKIKQENPDLADSLDLGFKHYRVVSPSVETLEDIEFNDVMQLDLLEDMISKFSSENLGVDGNASGIDTILQTYIVQDGYKLDVNIEYIELGEYKVPYINNQRIYIISNNWNNKATEKLVNMIGRNEIQVQTIVVYGYSFDAKNLRTLEYALNQLDNKVNLQIRY